MKRNFTDEEAAIYGKPDHAYIEASRRRSSCGWFMPRTWNEYNASFYKWRSKYGGMDAALLSEMKAMAEENKRLKRMYAESQMQNELLKEALGKKW